MQLYVRRNGEEFGPYSRETLLEYVVAGAFETSDTVCYSGMSEWKNLGEFFGIQPGEVPGQIEDIENSGKITAFNPTWNPTQNPSEHHHPRKRHRHGGKGWLIGGTLGAVFLAATMGYKWFGGNGGPDDVASIALPSPSPAPSTPAPVPTISPVPAASPTPVATPMPTPIPPPESAMTSDNPEPDNSPSTPMPTPAEKPTPIPTPPPFDAANLANDPGDWPKTVHLKQATQFPVVLEGRNVGTVTVDAGRSVDLLKVQGEKVVIEFQGGSVAIPWQQTDLKERVESNPAYIPPAPAAGGAGAPAASPSPAASGGFVAPPS